MVRAMKKSLFAAGMVCLILGGGIKYVETPAHAQSTTEQEKPKVSAEQETPKKPQLKAPRTPKVKLLNPGAQPRQKLRFQPAVGSKQQSVMTTKTDMKMSVDGQPVRAFAVPATVVTINTVINKVEPNGDIGYDFSYSDINVVKDPNVDPKLLEAMRKQFAQIKEMKGSGVMDSLGNTKQFNLVLADVKDPLLKQTMQQFSNSLSKISSPVPEEAVGKGAQWVTTNTIEFNGIKITQTETYNLIDVKDGVATVQTKVQQQAQPMQKVSLPGLPPNAALTLQSYNGNGQGNSQIVLNKLMPVSSNASIASNINWDGKFSPQTKKINMNQEVLVQVNMQSK